MGACRLICLCMIITGSYASQPAVLRTCSGYGWTMLDDTCYKASSELATPDDIERMCSRIAGSGFTMSSDISTVHQFQANVMEKGDYTYGTQEVVNEEQFCEAVDVQKTLTCPEGQNILLYRPEAGGYMANRPCGADFQPEVWCDSQEVLDAWQSLREQCAQNGSTCQFTINADLIKSCSPDRPYLKFEWSCTDLPTTVTSDSIWNRFHVKPTIPKYPICQKSVTVMQACPVNTYSETGYVSDQWECFPCAEGMRTRDVGSMACDSACIPDKREVKELRRLTKVLMLFPDFHFQCDGYVTSVEFYAHESGTFYLSSWKQTGDDRYTLQSYNSITVTRSGNQTYEIPADARMFVNATDFIGIFHSNRQPANIIATDTRSGLGPSVTDSQLSKYCTVRKFLEDFEVGQEIRAISCKRNKRRTLPLNANIVSQ